MQQPGQLIHLNLHRETEELSVNTTDKKETEKKQEPDRQIRGGGLFKRWSQELFRSERGH